MQYSTSPPSPSQPVEKGRDQNQKIIFEGVIYNIAFDIDVVCNGAGNASANPLKRVRGLREGPTTAA